MAWEPAEVACQVAAALLRYERVTGNLIRRVAQSQAVNQVRFATKSHHGNHRRPNVELTREITMNLAAPAIQSPRASASCPELISRAMVLATRRQRQVVKAVVACGGSYSIAARRLAVTRQAVCATVRAFRARAAQTI